eukprot:GHVT01069989.1.p1 GENE.GHVT01069989.1~~GHVT01069989.1.p1  ORF type:complete len:528 (+),score=26.79 GHVT01069989.1:1572-3155(+)
MQFLIRCLSHFNVWTFSTTSKFSISICLWSLQHCAFVLVAGGLGERLGYPDIKIGLPSEISTETSYIELYCSYLRAYQTHIKSTTGKEVELPLAIMTSDDTHAKTAALLKHHKNYGLGSSQITLMKQSKVPALMDSAGRIAVVKDDPYSIETKPHGHGDVHLLLEQSGLTTKWVAAGFKWLIFFQDTNGIVFRAIPAAVGVSATRGLTMNSLTVQRKPKEALGAICCLTPPKESTANPLTINIEYNMLDGLLSNRGGDVADSTGFSPYPGNMNVLVFNLPRYAAVLKLSKGNIPEFINPKYKDATKKEFKSCARVECMMQEFARLLTSPSDLVGFTEMPRWFCFSTSKNNAIDASVKVGMGLAPESIFSAEADQYANCAKILEICAKAKGCEVDIASPTLVTFLGVSYRLGPSIVIKPSLGTTLKHIQDRICPASRLKIHNGSSLIIDGDVELDGLELRGALVLRAAPGAKLVVKNLRVENLGWQFKVLEDGSAEAKRPELAARGYYCSRLETREEVAEYGTRVISN